jgi:hypothetical protein
MQHSVEQLIERLTAMRDKAIHIHRLRNQYSKLANETYDRTKCQALLDDIQAMALTIANDKTGTEIITEMESWKTKE